MYNETNTTEKTESLGNDENINKVLCFFNISVKTDALKEAYFIAERLMVNEDVNQRGLLFGFDL